MNSLPIVLDPSIKTLAAISRRANKKSININNQSNHDRKKRSSKFSLQNLDIGDNKYLSNIIGVENPEFEYRRPWRIANTRVLPIVKKAEYSNSERDYPSYKSQENAEISNVKRNSIPNLSSIEDKYQNIHKSSYYPISSSFLSVDESLPINSISSPSLSSSSMLKDPPSSYKFNSKKSFYKSQQNSDLNKRKNNYQIHQGREYKHFDNNNINVNKHDINNKININNDIEKHSNDNDMSESELIDIQPVAFQSSSKLSVDSRSHNHNNHNNVNTNFASYGTKDKNYDESHKLQIKNVASQKDPIMGTLAVEEPLALASSQRLASSSSSSRSGQREQLPPAAATSNIINAGQSMVRSIMKRRTKTGRYDVPQVGKYQIFFVLFIDSSMKLLYVSLKIDKE